MTLDSPNRASVARAKDACWRIAPDRVLVRRTRVGGGSAGVEAAADLMGAAALVWVALDEPATPATLVERFSDAEVDAPSADALAAAIESLLAAGWITTAGDG